MADTSTKQPEQPKVLRIGVLQGGKVVQERVVKAGQDVTIGESPRCTFVVTGKGVPKRYSIFTFKSGQYQFAFTQEMDGKLSLDEGMVSCADLRSRPGTVKKGDTWILPINDKCRGKVSLGELTVLFQFVPAPPESAKLMGAQDFRPRLIDDDDPVFLGFLGLFSTMAAVLMVYVYNTEPMDLVTADDIPDRFALVAPPDTDTPDTEDAPELETLEGEEVLKEKEDASIKPKNEGERKMAEASAREQKRQDVTQRSLLLAGLIGTTGDNNSGRQIEDLLGANDSKFGNLSDALQNVGGVAEASEASLAANRGATDGRGSGDSSIGQMSQAGTGTGAGVGSGPAAAPKARAVNPETDGGSATGADAAAALIRKNKAQIQTCYEAELKNNPSLRGRLAVAIDVQDGQVRVVRIEDNQTGNKAVEDCVKRRIRTWRFDASVSGELYSSFVFEPAT